MTHDFDHVRAAFASSGPGRILAGITRIVECGWRTSSFKAAGQSVRGWFSESSRPRSIRTAAMAIAIAASLQPLLIQVMSATVAPAMPTAMFIGVALIAAGATVRSDDAARAWPASRLARWLR